MLIRKWALKNFDACSDIGKISQKDMCARLCIFVILLHMAMGWGRGALFIIRRNVIINKVGEGWERWSAKNKKRLQY